MAKIISLTVGFLLLVNFSFAEENHAGELGYCVICNTVIMDRVDYHIRPNDEYNEIWFEFSNDSKGRVAFCDMHYEQFIKTDITRELSDRIMEGIKRGWEKEFILNDWTKDKIDKYKLDFFNLEITKRISDEEISNN